MGRVFANGPGDLDSIPGLVIPKTLKMVLDTSLLNTQLYKVRIKGKVEQSRERSSALSYTSVLYLLKREPSGRPRLKGDNLLTYAFTKHRNTYKEGSALNNLWWLICHKTYPNHNKTILRPQKLDEGDETAEVRWVVLSLPHQTIDHHYHSSRRWLSYDRKKNNFVDTLDDKLR